MCVCVCVCMCVCVCACVHVCACACRNDIYLSMAKSRRINTKLNVVKVTKSNAVCGYTYVLAMGNDMYSKN